jgi:hypothetical protein
METLFYLNSKWTEIWAQKRSQGFAKISRQMKSRYKDIQERELEPKKGEKQS